MNDGGAPAVTVAVTETWFKGYITDAQVAIPGYDVYRSDRESRIGGGCALYVHSSLAVCDQACFASATNNLIAVYVNEINTIFAVVYRAECSMLAFRETMCVLTNFIDKHSVSGMPDVFVSGDFNLPLFQWVDGASIPIDQPMYTVVQDFMDSYFLTQVVEGPTRGNNTLDLVFTNRPEYIDHTQLSDEGISDHLWVSSYLTFNPLGPSSALLSSKLEGYRALDIHYPICRF
jgi:hypothetical protein